MNDSFRHVEPIPPLEVLRASSVPAHWVKMVEEVSELETEEQGRMLGDSLPIGLRLK